jgi:hypothetical protein
MNETLSHGFSEACFEQDEFDYSYFDLDDLDDLDDEAVQDYFDNLYQQ